MSAVLTLIMLYQAHVALIKRSAHDVVQATTLASNHLEQLIAQQCSCQELPVNCVETHAQYTLIRRVESCKALGVALPMDNKYGLTLVTVIVTWNGVNRASPSKIELKTALAGIV